jgi:NitT/TauT family transport system substrate-binding protein
MTTDLGSGWTRRHFLGAVGATGAAGMAGLLGVPPGAAAEPPPETTRLRLPNTGAVCLAPQYAAEELLRAEGFTDVQYNELRRELKG